MLQAPFNNMPGITHPIIMAPMFLVSNKEMLKAAYESGITGCIPALNARTEWDFKELLNYLDAYAGVYGINLIANQSNPHLKWQLDCTLNSKASYIITSLGNPEVIIRRAHEKNKRVFCDVVDVHYAKKVVELGADALIAVHSGAGGHAGNYPASILVPTLKQHFSVPIILAGGIGDPYGYHSAFAMGASGVSIGSPFIATLECSVSETYKKACVDYGAKDIVLSEKLSGTPCTVIATPYVKKVGTQLNGMERFLLKHKRLKKYLKALTFYRGMKMLEKAAFSTTYQSVWCAGPSIEFTKEITSIRVVVENIIGKRRQDNLSLDT